MKANFKISAVAILILATPILAHAGWYWLNIPDYPTIGEFTELSAVEYAVTLIPKNQLQSLPETFMETMDFTKESEACSEEYNTAIGELRDFDETHEFYSSMPTDCRDDDISCIENNKLNQETIDARAALLVNIEKGAQQCLKTEQDAIEEQTGKETEEARLAEIQEAIEDCDFDFFEKEMTNTERINSWKEREACKNKTESIVETATPKPVEAPIPIKQRIVSYVAPTITSATNPVPYSLIQAKQKERSTDDSQITVEATSTETVIEQLPEDTLESVVEPLNAEGIQKEPSFFRKITNFFTKLFSW